MGSGGGGGVFPLSTTGPPAGYGGGDEGRVPGKYRGTKGAGPACAMTGTAAVLAPRPFSSSSSS